jgi:phosphoenolpyruvate mutase
MILPEIRRKSLREKLQKKQLVTAMEAHSGLSASIVEHTKTKDNPEGYGAIWMSSLTESSSKGYPDSEYLNINSRYDTLVEILNNSTKPIIYDADTGSFEEHFILTVKKLEMLGVSAVVIEDKKGLKQNSLLGSSPKQQAEDINVFSSKIKAGKAAQKSSDFMIVARIESLILGAGQEDATKRANAYIAAGADAILIHSKSETIDEVEKFILDYRKINSEIPIVIVPSTYDEMTNDKAKQIGANIVIYANQLLRASFTAMSKMATDILEQGSSHKLTDKVATCKDIIKLRN